jgi:hypothetical protein
MRYDNVESFTFIENSQKSVEKSFDIIEKSIQSGKIKEEKQPDKIEPMVFCEET